MQVLARGAMEELRSVVFALRPGSLAEEGLERVLRKHVDVLRRVSGQPIELEVGAPGGLGEISEAAAGQVLRIAQEALQNALRHAGSARVIVRLADGDGRFVLSVSDDGRGFDPAAGAARGRRLGLTSMEERAAALGGTLTIVSAPGAGTTVRLEVPAS